jgi:hypothetical protein
LTRVNKTEAPAIEVFLKLVPLLDPATKVFAELLAAVVESALSPHAECRAKAYEACFQIATKLSNAAADGQNEEGKRAPADPLVALRRGLNDADVDLRQRCRSFWLRRVEDKKSAGGRLGDVLSSIYSPDTEPKFVANSLYLVLHLTLESSDFKRSPFPSPLAANVEFKHYQITSTSRRTRASLQTPLFTQNSAIARFGGRSRTRDLDPSIMATVRSGILNIDAEPMDGAGENGIPGHKTFTQGDRMDITQSQVAGTRWNPNIKFS